MTRKTLSLPEIRAEGLKALCDRLGPAGMVRFLQLFEPGRGDYTRERRAWLDKLSVDDISQGVRTMRAGRKRRGARSRRGRIAS
jgi:hypothetical protein